MTSAVSTHDARRTASVTLKAVVLLSGVLTIVFVVSFLFSRGGTSELQRARRRVDNLQADIQRLKSDNARLQVEIESVRKSTFAVERIAREQLGMSRKGEIVYLLPSASRPDPDPQRGTKAPPR